MWEALPQSSRDSEVLNHADHDRERHPGYEITDVYGEVFGLTVRSRNAFSQFGAGLKSIMGGELKG